MRSPCPILVGVELHPKTGELPLGSRNAVAQATWLAERFGGELVVLHSTWSKVPVDLPDPPQRPGPEGRAVLEGLAAELEGQGLRPRVQLSAERPFLAILRAALAGRADWVVVGKRDESVTEGRRLGSTALRLLRKCPVPLWVVKPEHDRSHKLVLVATDLTTVGDRAVEQAAFVAGEEQAELHAVHAYRLPLSLQLDADRLSEEAYAERVDAIKAAAQAHVEGVLLASGFDGESSVHLSKNPPYLAIREAQQHLHPDLLVMGTVSEGGVPGLLVGDTAERLLDRVDCSILALKPDDFVCPVG